MIIFTFFFFNKLVHLFYEEGLEKAKIGKDSVKSMKRLEIATLMVLGLEEFFFLVIIVEIVLYFNGPWLPILMRF